MKKINWRRHTLSWRNHKVISITWYLSIKSMNYELNISESYFCIIRVVESLNIPFIVFHTFTSFRIYCFAHSICWLYLSVPAGKKKFWCFFSNVHPVFCNVKLFWNGYFNFCKIFLYILCIYIIYNTYQYY